MRAFLILGAVIFLMMIGFSTVIYLQTKKIESQTAVVAQMQQQIAGFNTTIKAMQDDAASTKLNQLSLFSTLNKISIQTEKDKDAPLFTPQVLADSSKDSKALEAIVNKQTGTMLHSFEALSGNGK